MGSHSVMPWIIDMIKSCRSDMGEAAAFGIRFVCVVNTIEIEIRHDYDHNNLYRIEI